MVVIVEARRDCLRSPMVFFSEHATAATTAIATTTKTTPPTVMPRMSNRCGGLFALEDLSGSVYATVVQEGRAGGRKEGRGENNVIRNGQVGHAF